MMNTLMVFKIVKPRFWLAKPIRGLYCVVEHDLLAGFPGPPPYAHQETAHTFYVIQGIVRLVVDSQIVEATAGTSVYIPPESSIIFSIPVRSEPV